MGSDVLHVVFTAWGAKLLREALRMEGRKERVVCLLDDLSFGPIDPPEPDIRKAWIKTELGFTAWPDTPEGRHPWATTEFGEVSWNKLRTTTHKFWNEALSGQSRKIVWLTRRSAREFTGFLEWLWRAGDAPCEIVDLTDCIVSRHREDQPSAPAGPAVSLRRLWPKDTIGNRLLDRAEQLQVSDRHRYRELWQQLRADNAPFRVLSSEGLVSAPITFFDQTLMSSAISRWFKVARIVSDAFEALGAGQNDDFLPPDEMVLAARINALVKSGQLEFQGRTAFATRFSEARLPPPKADPHAAGPVETHSG